MSSLVDLALAEGKRSKQTGKCWFGLFLRWTSVFKSKLLIKKRCVGGGLWREHLYMSVVEDLYIKQVTHALVVV